MHAQIVRYLIIGVSQTRLNLGSDNKPI